ncbi:MAG: PAS domain-containing protein [Cyanobacteria bacterium J06635_15]
MSRLIYDLKILKQECDKLKLDYVSLKNVLEAMVDGVVLLNQQGEMLYTNNKAKQLLGTYSQGAQCEQCITKELDWMCEEIRTAQRIGDRKSPILESEVLLPEGKILRIRAHYRLQPSEVSHFIWVFLEATWLCTCGGF